jgi:N-acetylglucosamine repressor
MRVTDHRALKINNLLLILRILRGLGPVSRKRLKDESSLSWGTITAAVKELIDAGIVVEAGKVRTGVGRMPVDIELDRRNNCVVGLRLGETFLRSVVLDIAGGVIGQYQVPADPSASRSRLLSDLFGLVELSMRETSTAAARIAGIGFTAPGVVDSDRGICRYAPHHPHWRDIPVRQIFQERYGIPCFVEHNSNCSALAEKWSGVGHPYRDFVCVSIGNGIGVGIIIDGKVYRGADFSAGEFGHTCLDPDGESCACGKRGCLELFASGLAVGRNGSLAARNGSSPLILELAGGDPDRVTAEMVGRAARAGDPTAHEIFREMGRTLGVAVGNLITLLNPECIVLSGGVSGAYDIFGPALERAVAERAWTFSRREIRVSTLPDPAVLGAAGIVLEEIYHGGLLFNRVS